MTLPGGQAVSYTYDARDNLLSTTTTSPTSSTITTSATYESSCTSGNILYCNKPKTTTDALGNVTNYYYDEASQGHGQLTRMTLPSPDGVAARPEVRTTYISRQAYYKTGSSTWSSGTAVWLPESVKTCATGAGSSCANAANEVVVETSYGPTSGANTLLPVSVSTRAGNASSGQIATTTATYNVIGQLTSVDGPLTTADGLASNGDDTTWYRYDAYWRPVGVVTPDPDGGGSLKPQAQKTVYNSTTGNVDRVEVGTVNAASDSPWDTNFTVLTKTETAYDSRNRPAKQTLKNGAGTILSVSQVSYNGVSQVICQTQRMNSADFSSPPAACTQGTGSKDQITQNAYDSAGRLYTVTAGVGTSLSQTERTLTYHTSGYATGELATLTDARGYKTSYDYDTFGRFSKISYPSKTTTGVSENSSDYELYGFDAAGQVTSYTPRGGSAVGLTYDNLGRLTTGIDGTTYTYDNLGRRATVARSGRTITYAYDAVGNMLSETSSTLGAMSYQYDLGGRRTRMTWPDGVYVTYVWGAASQLNDIRLSGSYSLASFGYDSDGRRTSLYRGTGLNVSYYHYDDRSLMWALDLNFAGTAYDQASYFTRDAAGRITNRHTNSGVYEAAAPSTGTVSYTPNGLNQITTGGGVSWTHDSRGNATAVGANSFTYDTVNRMTGLTGAVSLAYDPLGRLYEYAGSTTTRLQYDGADLVAEYDTSGNVLRRYVHGPGSDEPIVWFEGSGTSTSDRRYLVADERGSIVGVVDGVGASLATNTYDEYGKPTTTNATYASRFGYTGQTWLGDMGLYYYKARMYAPDFGRFMQTDPIGYADGLNMYAYVGNDPVNSTDPTGLYDLQCGPYTYKNYNDTGNTYSPDDERYFARLGCEVTGPVDDVPVVGQRREHHWYDFAYDIGDWLTGRDVGPNELCMMAGGYGSTIDRCTALNQGITANGRQNAVAMGGAVATGTLVGTGVGVVGAGAAAGSVEGAAAARPLLGTTQTVAKNLATRPYINSQLLVDEIMATGTGAADSAVPGALRYDVLGTFGENEGAYQLVIDPAKNFIYHFMFKTF